VADKKAAEQKKGGKGGCGGEGAGEGGGEKETECAASPRLGEARRL